ncbi:MAG: hypothetical protein AB7D33_04450 [Sphingobium sp.]
MGRYFSGAIGHSPPSPVKLKAQIAAHAGRMRGDGYDFEHDAMLLGLARFASLDPFAASQPVTAAYSLRRLRDDYDGPAIQIRDSGAGFRTLYFREDGTLDTALLPTYGDGQTFSVVTWYDQTSGAAHHLAANNAGNRPLLVFPDAPASYDHGYIDYISRTKNLVSADGEEFLNVGGTANLAIFAVAGTFGWTSGGVHARNPPVYSGISGPVLGWGAANNEGLFGAYGGPAETCLYGRNGELFVDAGTPDASRWRNIWFNQRGGIVSGGADRRQMFADRPHGVEASGPLRIIMGNSGNMVAAHNGGIREVILYQNAAALSDLECRRIAAGQNAAWPDLARARLWDRFRVIFAGQSNAANYGQTGISGDGTAGSDALRRVFDPALAALLGVPANTDRDFSTVAATTAYGNSSIIKAVRSNDDNYWWDQDTDSPGPLCATWTPYASQPGLKYRRVVIMWAQGEREAWQQGGTDYRAQWKADTKKVWAYLRSVVGYDCPILVQPLGKQAGKQAEMDAYRAVQYELAAEVSAVFVGDETIDLEMQDSVHFSSSLKEPNQSPNGYDLGASRLAARIGPILLAMAAR